MKEFWKHNYQGLEEVGWNVELFAQTLLPDYWVPVLYLSQDTSYEQSFLTLP